MTGGEPTPTPTKERAREERNEGGGRKRGGGAIKISETYTKGWFPSVINTYDRRLKALGGKYFVAVCTDGRIHRHRSIGTKFLQLNNLCIINDYYHRYRFYRCKISLSTNWNLYQSTSTIVIGPTYRKFELLVLAPVLTVTYRPYKSTCCRRKLFVNEILNIEGTLFPSV